MLFDSQTKDFFIFSLRRKELIRQVKKQFPNKLGKIILFGSFETERTVFRQESSFYYFTGIQEPGVVLVLDIDKEISKIYVPNCVENRSKWMFSTIPIIQDNAKLFGVDNITVLGDACAGYQFHPFFPKQEYTRMISLLTQMVNDKKTVFTLSPNNPNEYIEQRLVLERLNSFVPGLKKNIRDISPIVACMRRSKDTSETDNLFLAIRVTVAAQEAAAKAITDEQNECEVQGILEYMMTGFAARKAFPSIVASGINSTTLHYTANDCIMKNGDLVVVDIGAEVDYYCADLTRTYPVSGTFTNRQKKVYNIVLETQKYIANIAKPGMYLSNKEQKDKSLNHLARNFLQEKGYEKYFIHGIGHFLGLDVHDVGDYMQPLQEDDVITIEPGIYIPEEQIGIRIEDNYCITKKGAVCMSDYLPKEAEDIEKLVQQKLEDTEIDESFMQESLSERLDLDDETEH